MNESVRVVIIEDSQPDIQKAFQILQSLGVAGQTVFTDLKKGLFFLEDVVSGNRPCPDLIVLDLEFGGDSGFEVLRFYKTNPALRECKIVVWTVLGDTQQELAKLFRVTAVISKHAGNNALRDALSNILREITEAAGAAGS